MRIFESQAAWTAVVLLILIVCFYPVVTQQHAPARTESCLSNVKQLSLGALMYAQDFDDRFPSAPTWRDQITPYLGTTDHRLRCTQLKKEGKQGWGYGFNSNESGQQDTVPNAKEIPLVYECADLSRNASAPGRTGLALPPRHNEANAMAFADGHSKWIRAQSEER